MNIRFENCRIPRHKIYSHTNPKHPAQIAVKMQTIMKLVTEDEGLIGVY